MAQHWSTYVPGVTYRQALALDRIAITRGKRDGMDLLMEARGVSRSNIGKTPRITLQLLIDGIMEAER